jgi:hypothetical protein
MSAASLVPRAKTQQPRKPSSFQASAASSAFGSPSKVSSIERAPEIAK